MDIESGGEYANFPTFRLSSNNINDHNVDVDYKDLRDSGDNYHGNTNAGNGGFSQRLWVPLDPVPKGRGVVFQKGTHGNPRAR